MKKIFWFFFFFQKSVSHACFMLIRCWKGKKTHFSFGLGFLELKLVRVGLQETKNLFRPYLFSPRQIFKVERCACRKGVNMILSGLCQSCAYSEKSDLYYQGLEIPRRVEFILTLPILRLLSYNETRLQTFLITILNPIMLVFICSGVKKSVICLRLTIQISTHKKFGCPEGDFWGFGCPNDTQAPSG